MSKYYSLERVKKVDAEFKMLLGGRNIGKSYAVKHDVAKECFTHGLEFVYLRRWDEDIKQKNAINYFGDLNVKEITDNKYTDVYIYQSKIYFVSYDENGKISDRYLIGYTHALNQNERYKSQIFPKVTYIIYEEFITDRMYLPNECNQLQEYVSTIFRDRKGVVYLVGNTISKLCPYFNEWKLDKVSKMKVHEICVFENTTDVMTPDGVESITVRIAVEMCGAQTVLSKMAFGDSANMIVKNEWRSKTVARLEKDVYDLSDTLHTVFVIADNLTFKMELLQYESYIFWYVTPFTSEIKHKDETRVIQKDASMSPYHTVGFNPITEREQIAFNLIRQNKIFYCSNSCGSDFEMVLRKFHLLTSL